MSWSHFQGSSIPVPSKVSTIYFPETSVTDYQSTLYKIPEERRFHLQRGGSLKPRIRSFEKHKKVEFVFVTDLDNPPNSSTLKTFNLYLTLPQCRVVSASYKTHTTNAV